MNLCDCVVTRVFGVPEYHVIGDVSWWDVFVQYNSWGHITEGYLSFPTFEQAYAVVEGYKFLA